MLDEFYKKINMLKKVFFRFLSNPKENNKSFYTLSPTCQIPNLGIIYEQYFGKRHYGTFIEVGAFDGEYVSNTSGLADIGWNGVYIEPVPEFFSKCKFRHKKNKNVKVIQTAVGAEDGSLIINIGGPLSTAHNEMRENFKNLEWAKSNFSNESTCIANLTTLDSLLEQNMVKKGFELLVIDVEGYEWNVLKVFDIAKWKPQMIIIELHDQNDEYFHIREECKNIVGYFEKAKYKVIFKDFSNTIYVPQSYFPMPIDER